jgi:hypothetical protein
MFPMMHRMVLFVVCILLVSACASQSAQPLPTSTPTDAPAPTSAPTDTPLPTSTATVTLTPTAAATATTTPTNTPVPTPTIVSGELALARGIETSRPAAIMFDNHPNAYPQTGLNRAVIVFEALAEFGITRYMGIFVDELSGDLPTIGPVRSARPYFVEWAKGMRATYAHAGGSPEGLLLAQTSIELLNMDALRRDAEDYFRRSSARFAPHNLYTSSADIRAFNTANETEPPDVSENGYLFKADAPPAERPATQGLRYFFIYRETSVGWTYDPTDNSYLYFRGNNPHIDAATGLQLRFKNVVVMEVPEAPIPGDPKGRIEQQVIGNGTARIFRDGQMLEATWSKPAGFAPLRLYAPDGNEIVFNVGSIWIAAIPSLENLVVSNGE